MFYSLYIKPNDDNNGHLIYDLSTDKIVVTMNYQSVPVPKDLIKAMNKTDSSNNKIRIDHFYIEQSIVQENYSNNNDYKSHTPNNSKDNSEDGNTDELDNSQHPDDMILDKIVDHKDQIILTKETYNSTSISMNASTNIDTPIPFFYSVYMNYKVYLYSMYTKPQLLFCVYIISTKTHLQIYIYYHRYKFFCKCLYMKTFYIISTKTSLQLYLYCCLCVHLYNVNSYNHLYSCL